MAKWNTGSKDQKMYAKTANGTKRLNRTTGWRDGIRL